MSPRIKILIGVGSTLILVIVSVLFIGFYLARRSFPTVAGTETMETLRESVKVYRDSYGVPHIVAGTLHDAYAAVGFVHAQDRLWQMEIARRAGMGRLAEVFGEETLKFDRMFRTLGLWQHAQALSQALDEETRSALESYTEGVNQFVNDRARFFPAEYDILGIRPEPWTIEHSIVISRLMAWELNYSRWVDITFGEIIHRIGNRGAELFPRWPAQAPTIMPSGPEERTVALLEKKPKSEEWSDIWSSLRNFMETETQFRKFMGAGGYGGGSNAWALSGKKTSHGQPILACDPHLFFTTPARWYELHVAAPTLEVSGASVAGIPFVVIGRNRHIAWGVTNAMLDDQDFYRERVDSLEHPRAYWFNNAWTPLVERVDTILVKDHLPILISSYHTHRGPIVNRFEPSAELARSLLSIRWMGNEISGELSTFLKINRATNWKEFQEALRTYAVPAQNFVYADVGGNIGYRLGGKIPIRPREAAMMPSAGWTDATDWTRYVPFEQMPTRVNPPEGFIATANNQIAGSSFP
jgi:penicillin G amidase